MVLALTQHAGHRLGEVGFVLGIIGGAGLAASGLVPAANQPGKLIGGLGIGIGSLLLLIAAHWGRFG